MDSFCKVEDSDEVISSEELLAEVDEVAAKLQAEGIKGGVFVGSLDAKALYPFLDI